MPMPPPPKDHKEPRIDPRSHFLGAADMWADFEDYQAWCKLPANAIKVGSKGRTTERPMTLQGFANFSGCSPQTLRRAGKREDLKECYERICAIIEDSLLVQGLVRTFDGSLVARVAGIADKQHVTHEEGEGKPTEYDWTKLTDDEMKTLQALLTKARKD